MQLASTAVCVITNWVKKICIQKNKSNYCLRRKMTKLKEINKILLLIIIEELLCMAFMVIGAVL